MDRLYFGTRARRRARLKRALFWASLLSTAATIAGLPGTGGVLELARRWEAIAGRPATGIETSETISSMRRFQNEMFRTRPQPTPTQTTPPSIEEIVSEAAERHGLSAGYLLSIADCESGLNPNAYNAAGYHGLFQFDQTTWAQYGEGSIWDPAAQADAAAELIAAGQSNRWPVCA